MSAATINTMSNIGPIVPDTIACSTEPKSETAINEKVSELDHALRTMNLSDINDDYSNWAIAQASKKDVALLHGSATVSVIKSSTDKKKITSVMAAIGKKALNFDIHLETLADGSNVWFNTAGEQVTIEKVHPSILKYLNSNKNGFSLTVTKKSQSVSSLNTESTTDKIKFIYSGEHTRYSEPDNKSELLATHTGENINCHVFNHDTGKYLFMGKLKLVHVQKIEVPFNGSIVSQYLFYFA